MTPHELQVFVEAIVHQSGLPRGRAAIVQALIELSIPGTIPEASVSDIIARVSAAEGKSLDDGTFRQRLKRANADLTVSSAVFRLETHDRKVRAVPAPGWQLYFKGLLVGQTLERSQDAQIRLDATKMTQPRAVEPSLDVFFSYATLNSGQQEIQEQFFSDLSDKLSRPPARWLHLPPIRIWYAKSHIDRSLEGQPQMDEACRKAFMILMMLSDKFAHSSYCQREVGFFITENGATMNGKRAMGLRVNLNLKDVDDRYTYGTRVLLAGPLGETLLKTWEKGISARHDFVEEVAEHIWLAANTYIHAPKPPDGPNDGVDIGDMPNTALYPPDKAAPPRATETRLNRAIAAHDDSIAETGIDIVSHLAAWAQSTAPGRPRLTALLGDFGMGKTVTCQLVRQRLRDARRNDPSIPPAIYLDLRKVRSPEDPSRTGLHELLRDMLRDVGEQPPTPEMVIDYARNESALVIFDGLDEITNRIPDSAARQIYRELLSIVPASVWLADQSDNRNDAPSTFVKGPSLLISCRTQYFADVAAERGFLTDSERSGLRPNDGGHFATFIMLPFNDGQIEDYLSRNFNDHESTRVMALLESTYDLRGMVRRPILLRFVGEMVDQLEREKLAGRAVNISRLYDIIVEQAFERDSPKHVIPIIDKRKLLRALALYLHERGEDMLSNSKLADWLDVEIGRHHFRLAASLVGKEGLQLGAVFLQDLRNATLLSRPSETEFAFGHTSLREYFLADALYQAAVVGKASELWKIPMPSAETLDFIAARHAVEVAAERKDFVKNFPALISPGQPLAVRQLAFSLWRRAASGSDPLPRPQQLDLSSLDLSRSVLAGTPHRKMPLHNSIWLDARLVQTEFRDVDLGGAAFEQVDARRAKFVRAVLASTTFHNSDLRGSEWRSLKLGADSLEGARLEFARAENCQLGDSLWQPQFAPPNNAQLWKAIRRENRGSITSLAFGVLRGSAVLASGGSDGTVRIWDAECGTLLQQMQQQTGKVNSLAFGMSAGRTVLASAGNDCSVWLWDAERGAELQQMQGHTDRVNSVACSMLKGRSILASGGNDGTVRLWDIESGAELQNMQGHSGWVLSVTFGTLGGRVLIASGGGDGVVRLWDAESGIQLQQMDGYTGWVVSVAFGMLEEQAVIASSSSDGAVRLWDVESNAVVKTLHDHNKPVHSNAFGLLDGRSVIASRGRDGTVRLWDTESGIELRNLQGHKGSGTSSVAFGGLGGSPVIASGGEDGAVEMWDAESGVKLQQMQGRKGGGVSSMAFGMLGGRTLVASGGNDKIVRLWDAASGVEFQQMQMQVREGWINSIEFGILAGRTVIASGGSDSTVRLWDAESGAEIQQVQARNGEVFSVAFGMLASHTVIASGGSDSTVRLWDVESGVKLKQMQGHDGWVHSVAIGILAGRTTIASGGSDGTIRLWDADSGAEIQQVHACKGEVISVAFGILGGRSIIASGADDGTVRIWDAENGAAIRQMQGHNGRVNSVAFSILEGRSIIASGGRDGTVRIWDAENGAELQNMQDHEEGVLMVAFGILNDHVILASGGKDNTLCIWDRFDAKIKPRRKRIRIPGMNAGIDFELDIDGKWKLFNIEEEAWKIWLSTYNVDETQHLTGIEDMLRAQTKRSS